MLKQQACKNHYIKQIVILFSEASPPNATTGAGFKGVLCISVAGRQLRETPLSAFVVGTTELMHRIDERRNVLRRGELRDAVAEVEHVTGAGAE